MPKDAILGPAEPTPAKLPALVKLSDSAFAHQLQHNVKRRLSEAGIQLSDDSHLCTTPSVTLMRKSTFNTDEMPPKDVACFLCRVYFDFAQTSTVWIEQPYVEAKIEQLYSRAVELRPEDHPWICSLLVVMTIAVRCAHLTSGFPQLEEDDTTHSSGVDYHHDDVNVRLDRMAADLSLDAARLPSVDSMQTFVLLANLALNMDNPNLACTHLRQAASISALIRKQNSSQHPIRTWEEHAWYDRLCRTVHTWDKRICILHGFPSSNYNDYPNSVKASSPASDVTRQQISPDARNDLFMQLTEWLGKFAHVSSQSSKSDKANIVSYFDRWIDARTSYKEWWSEHAISRIPILQLNRHTAPLHICYHLNVIVLGRPFIFRPLGFEQPSSSVEMENAIAELVDDAEYSAYEIIDICSMLDKSAALTETHHVEIHACRTAVLVMIAQSLIGRCHLFRGKLRQGLGLIRKLANTSSALDVSDINSIANKVELLAPHTKNQKYKTALSSCADGNDGYKRLRSWASKRATDWPSNSLDMEAFVGIDHNESNALDNMLEGSFLDSSLFDFDPPGSNGVGLGMSVY